MAEYLAPGVYVEELPSLVMPIQGVSTSTAGMVGVTERGPSVGLPVLVTNINAFRRRFGGFVRDAAVFGEARFLAHAVRGFFENGGRRLYVTRVVGAGAGAAVVIMAGGQVTRLAQNAANGDTVVELASLRGIDTTRQVTFRQVRNGVTTVDGPHVVADYDDAAGTVTLAGAGLTNDLDRRFTAVESDVPDPGTPVAISAADEGTWGDRLRIRCEPAQPIARAQVVGVTGTAPGVFDVVQLNSAANFYQHAIVEFNRGATKITAKVASVQGNNLVITTDLGAANALDPDAAGFATTAISCEFRVVVAFDDQSEDIGPLTLDDRTRYYYAREITRRSTLISVADNPDNATDDPASMPTTPNGFVLVIGGGADGAAPTAAQFVGVDGGPGLRTGLRVLEDIDEIAIMAVPGIVDQQVQEAMIAQCERLKDRFAILDPDYAAATALGDIRAQRGLYDTKYAALYFPRVHAFDPVTGDRDVAVPPSGHIAGIYARNDQERGVHKAPANEVIRDITGLDITVTFGEQEILNPDNINVLRDFRASRRGYRVWGARVLTSDASFKYVNVRRLFNYIEESIDEGTQYAVFEPNDFRLWARVRQSVTNFLTRVHRDGALMGRTPEEAFFVRCDETTMTFDDFDNGRMVMIIGIAPVKPAEFVIIRIGQKPGGAEIEEFV